MAVKCFNNASIATLSVSQLGILSPTESRHFPLSNSPCSAHPLLSSTVVQAPQWMLQAAHRCFSYPLGGVLLSDLKITKSAIFVFVGVIFRSKFGADHCHNPPCRLTSAGTLLPYGCFKQRISIRIKHLIQCLQIVNMLNFFFLSKS